MAKKTALGRGLGALLGEMEEVYDNEVPSTQSTSELNISDIKPNPYQPRKSFDEKSLAELSASIKEYGLIQPVVVIRDDDDKYILVAGERRLRASKMAKLKTIQAVVVTLDADKMRQHALIENIQRDELNAIDLAHAYEELLKVHEITHEELSSMIHKSRALITNSLRLLQLSKKTQKALLESKISAGHAKVLVGLSDKDQDLMVNSIFGQKLSVRETEAMAKSMKNGIATKAPVKKAATLDFSAVQNYFKDTGFKTTVKSNKFTIEFNSEDDVLVFLARLK